MKQEQPRRYQWRKVIYTPGRRETDVKVLTKGLNLSKNPEKIDDTGLTECDGFMLYSGLLRKDWSVIDSANVACDNITITAKASVETCLD